MPPPPQKPLSRPIAKPITNPGSSTQVKPGSSSSAKAAAKKKPTTLSEKIDAVAAKEMTLAEAMGLTRTEAYGLAFTAHRLFEHGQVERAKKILDGLMVANPKDAYFPALLGAIYGREGDEDEALRFYNRACKLDPRNLAARVNRADLLLGRGELAGALDDLVAATKLDPGGKTPQGKRALALARSTSQALHAALASKKRR
jgi:predicted Zn-dependent protease